MAEISNYIDVAFQRFMNGLRKWWTSSMVSTIEEGCTDMNHFVVDNNYGVEEFWKNSRWSLDINFQRRMRWWVGMHQTFFYYHLMELFVRGNPDYEYLILDIINTSVYGKKSLLEGQVQLRALFWADLSSMESATKYLIGDLHFLY